MINTRPKLLEFLDDEIIDALAYHMRDLGVLSRHNEHTNDVEASRGWRGAASEKRQAAQDRHLLWANGRTGNSDEHGARRDRHQAQHSAALMPINEILSDHVAAHLRRGRRHRIPIAGQCRLHARPFAATHLITGAATTRWSANSPPGIYTSPEISSLGRTERELTAEKVPYEIGHRYSQPCPGQNHWPHHGMLKLLFHRETLQILGIHCFG